MLNDEQRKMVESSVWVVNTALKKQGLEKNKDLKQDALLYMCKCAERFDKTQGVKWTTYAYKNVYLYIKRKNAKDTWRTNFIIGDDIFEMKDFFVDRFEEEMFDSPQLQLEEFMKHCSSQEQEIIQKKVQGYTSLEIAIQTNATKSQIDNQIRNIQQKGQEIVL